MPNAPKLNNAWWRWFGSGPRNPPVIIRLHGSAKVHRLGTIAGQRSRESAFGDGAMAVIGPHTLCVPTNQTRTSGLPRLVQGLSRGSHHLDDNARRFLRRPERLQLPFGLFHFILKLSVLRRPRLASGPRFAPGFDLV
jgi:hypothetical protein